MYKSRFAKIRSLAVVLSSALLSISPVFAQDTAPKLIPQTPTTTGLPVDPVDIQNKKAAPPKGFSINIETADIYKQLKILTLMDLSVGQSGLVSYPGLCADSSGLVYIDKLSKIEEAIRYGDGAKVTLAPDGGFDLVSVPGERSDAKSAQRFLILRIANARPCKEVFDNSDVPSERYVVVRHINGHSDAQSLLSEYIGVVGSESKKSIDLSGPITSVPTNGEEQWLVLRGKSPMDDSPQISMVLKQDHSSANRNPARLVLRCSENTTSAYINFDNYLGSDTPTMSLRLGDNPAQTVRWAISSDNKAVGVWSGGVAIPFLRRLVLVDKLVARITPYNESPTTATFSLGDIKILVREIANTCNWTL